MRAPRRSPGGTICCSGSTTARGVAARGSIRREPPNRETAIAASAPPAEAHVTGKGSIAASAGAVARTGSAGATASAAATASTGDATAAGTTSCGATGASGTDSSVPGATSAATGAGSTFRATTPGVAALSPPGRGTRKSPVISPAAPTGSASRPHAGQNPRSVHRCHHGRRGRSAASCFSRSPRSKSAQKASGGRSARFRRRRSSTVTGRWDGRFIGANTGPARPAAAASRSAGGTAPSPPSTPSPRQFPDDSGRRFQTG